VKAYVRAKWEVTQWLLDKAGVNTINAYRGIALPEEKFNSAEKVTVGNYTKMPTVVVDRNGAASFSTNYKVSDKWQRSNTLIRVQAPRTAAISVPAYGQNEQGEHETVLAGSAWSGWDAWTAPGGPRFEDQPVLHPSRAA
jgi:hypothetical protein